MSILRDLFQNNGLMSSEQLRSTHLLSKQDFFFFPHFLQLRHYVTQSIMLTEHSKISVIEKMSLQHPEKVSMSSPYMVMSDILPPDTQRANGV